MRSRDLEAAAARDEGGRRILEQVVEVAAGGAPQLQHVAEAARGDEGGARAVPSRMALVTTVVACDSSPTSAGFTP